MKKIFPKIIFLSVIALFFASAAGPIFAQTTTPETSTTTPPEPTVPVPTVEELMESLQSTLTDQLYHFSVDFSPQNPGANTRVSAQAISYAFDISRSSTSWFLNGKYAGNGKTFSFTTGALGSRLSLAVFITTPDGKNLSKEFTFQAAEVDILWETPGYAPASYRGKTLAVSQSLVKLTAIPQGISTAASRLIYEWKRNGKNLASASGAGKRTLSFYAAETGAETIELKVSVPDSGMAAQNSLYLEISRPKILFYEEDSWEGPQYQKELGSDFNLAVPQIIVRAEPYFFSKRALSGLSIQWQMNSKDISVPQKPNILPLAVPSEEAKGTSLINLSLSNPLNPLEAAGKMLQINFDTQ